MNRIVLNACLAAVVCATSITTSTYADIVIDWNATIRQVLQHDGTHEVNHANPGWATRSIAMTHAAIYDAFQAIERTHEPYLFRQQALSGTSLDAAVHQAAYEVLLNCYPAEAEILDSAYQARMALVPGGDDKDNGMALGSEIAGAYIAHRTGDHSDEMYPYTPGTEPGQWRPDPYHPDQAVWGPGWKHVQTFAIPSSSDFVNALPPPPSLTSDVYTSAFHQVKQYGELNRGSRTPDQEEIAHFWAYDRASMGPPPVLFIRNLEEIALQAGGTPAEHARLFATAAIAQADAAIAAWDAKFHFNFWRPVTAIHEADTDGNPHTDADSDWRPLGAPGDDPNDFLDDFTPPFPAWTSGHATMGGAVFKSIELFYGTNLFDEIDGVVGDDPLYTLTSQESGSGGMRQFGTFTQSAPLDVGTEDSPEGENGTSRIYLGIHWIFDQQDGITLGNSIADYVHNNHFQAVPEPAAMTSLLIGAWMMGLGRKWTRRR